MNAENAATWNRIRAAKAAEKKTPAPAATVTTTPVRHRPSSGAGAASPKQVAFLRKLVAQHMLIGR